MDNTATANTTTNRRHFIRLLGAAGCSVLLAPRLIGSTSATGDSNANSPLGNTAQTGTLTTRRACPCCEATSVLS